MPLLWTTTQQDQQGHHPVHSSLSKDEEESSSACMWRRALVLLVLALPALSAWESSVAAAARALQLQHRQVLSQRSEAFVAHIITRIWGPERACATALPTTELRAMASPQAKCALPASAWVVPSVAAPYTGVLVALGSSQPRPARLLGARGPPNWLRWRRLLI